MDHFENFPHKDEHAIYDLLPEYSLKPLKECTPIIDLGSPEDYVSSWPPGEIKPCLVEM